MPTRSPSNSNTSKAKTVLGKAALYYARSLGWPVFPLHGVRGGGGSGTCTCGRPDCGNAGKHPRTRNGFLDATKDEEQIAQWWEQWPDANIGIPTGRASGFLVVDIDPRNGGDLNWEDLRERVAGGVPSSVEALTGGGGRHLLFAYPTAQDGHAEDDRIPTSKLALGVDFKADGGYIVAAPSLHSSGRTYQWEASSRPGEVALAPCPGLFMSGLHMAQQDGQSSEGVKRKPGRPKKTGAVDGTSGTNGGNGIAQAPGAPLETSFLFLAFHAAGMIRERIDQDRCSVVCPWAHEHTTGGGSRDSSTILFAPSEARTLGWFHCSHSHCQGRGVDDVLQGLPASAVAQAKRIEGEMLASALKAAQPSSMNTQGYDGCSDVHEPPESTPTPIPNRIAQAPQDPNAWQAALSRTRDGGVRNTYGNVCAVLRGAYGTRLTYNEMRVTPCIDGEPLSDPDIGRLREEFEKKFGLVTGEPNIIQATRQIASERPFHPVRNYLLNLKWDGKVRIPEIARDILGVTDPMYTRFLTAWAVSAVARALDPGCKVDTSLVLFGKQGFFKSTFFNVLGGAYFADSAMDITARDGLMQLSSAWIYEWPELESITSKTQASVVKAFTTSRWDTFRPPFAKAVIHHPRSSVIVGSTNETQFLNDPTGSRRFWVVRVTRHVRHEDLAPLRDHFWAEALTNYQSNYRWWLTADEEDRREDLNADFQIKDALLDVLAEWLDGNEASGILARNGLITVSDLLRCAVKLDVAKWDQQLQARVGKVMKRLDWAHTRKRVNKKLTYGYIKDPDARPDSEPDEHPDGHS